MIEILFELDGVKQKEMACFDSLEEMQYFIKHFKEEVLANYPNATNIVLGKAYLGLKADL